jgi:hypothetical protein
MSSRHSERYLKRVKTRIIVENLNTENRLLKPASHLGSQDSGGSGD